MNSLSYLSRQFDVLSSPKRRRSDAEQTIPRVNTWSTKSFLFPPRTPRRSHSTPAFFTQPLPQSDPPLQRSKSPLDSVFRQIFFIRVFLLLWDNVSSAWHNLCHLWSTPIQITETPHSQPQPSPSPPPPRKTPFHQQKTLVLDLDETLIHSTSRPMHPASPASSTILGLASFASPNKGAGHTVEVVLAGRSTLYHVYKRPFVDFFLRTVSGWYTLVIFTASMQEYADPVIDWLDAGRGILDHRFFRDSCTQLPNGSYTKDLSVVDTDLSRVCLVDNSPISYRVNQANGIPIEGWTDDPNDEALLDLLPVLDSLRFTSDVRRVLGLRTAGVRGVIQMRDRVEYVPS